MKIVNKDPKITAEEAIAYALKDFADSGHSLFQSLACRSPIWEQTTAKLSADEVDFGIWTLRRIRGSIEFFQQLKKAAEKAGEEIEVEKGSDIENVLISAEIPYKYI